MRHRADSVWETFPFSFPLEEGSLRRKATSTLALVLSR
jgi:hypothetical protein